SNLPSLPRFSLSLVSFFFNDTAPPAIYTLSLHDALPICNSKRSRAPICSSACTTALSEAPGSASLTLSAIVPLNRWPSCGSITIDRKSTRLNSSHVEISYAVFCLKKKKNRTQKQKREQAT